MSRPPRVLIVDDRPDGEALGIMGRLAEMGLEAQVSFPSELSVEDLSDADLVLVDYELADWNQSVLPLANQCVNGWALAGTLRWQLASHDHRRTPALIALLTNRVATALDPFSSADRFSVVASLNGMEWVFDKRDPDLSPIATMARAAVDVWQGMTKKDLGLAFSIPDGDLYWEDMRSCGMPALELLRWQDGVALVRWLLQRVFPYPCFLLDEHHVAARLGVSKAIFERLVRSQGALGSAIKSASYVGLLAGFAGERWWARSLDDALWRLTEGRSASLKSVRELVAQELGLPVAEVSEGGSSPVVTVSEDLSKDDALGDASQCVRIRPDYWPAYALDAWALRGTVAGSESLQRIALDSWGGDDQG